MPTAAAPVPRATQFPDFNERITAIGKRPTEEAPDALRALAKEYAEANQPEVAAKLEAGAKSVEVDLASRKLSPKAPLENAIEPRLHERQHLHEKLRPRWGRMYCAGRSLQPPQPNPQEKRCRLRVCLLPSKSGLCQGKS